MSHMYATLAIFAGIVGLAVTGAAFYTVWTVFDKWRKEVARASVEDNGENGQTSAADVAGAILLRWTALDYAVSLLFAFGMVFLLADVVAIMRDRVSYPEYHYGYLLVGAACSFLGMLFMLVRLLVVLKLARHTASPAPHHRNEPNQADHAE